MKESFFLLLLVFLIAADCVGQDQPPPTVKDKNALVKMDIPKRSALIAIDSNLQVVLGDSLPNLLSTKNQFKVYALSSFLSEDLNEATLQGFPILKEAKISSDSLRALTNMLGQAQSYMLSNFTKMCYFLPNMGLRLYDDHDTVDILISLECNLVRFYFREADKVEFRTLDSDPSSALLNEVYRTYFPVSVASQSNKEVLETLSMQLIQSPLYITARNGDGWYKIAQRAKQKYGLDIRVRDICKVNNFRYEDAIQNKVFPKIGEQVLVGFVNE